MSQAYSVWRRRDRRGERAPRWRYTPICPGVQFYTGNFLDGQVPGKGGVKYARRQGYCFETQYYPNAVNMPGFASPIVKKGGKYDTTTSYKFMTV